MTYVLETQRDPKPFLVQQCVPPGIRSFRNRMSSVHIHILQPDAQNFKQCSRYRISWKTILDCVVISMNSAECNCDMDFGVHRFSCPRFGYDESTGNDSCNVSAAVDGSADAPQAAYDDSAVASIGVAHSTLQVLKTTKLDVTLTISVDDLGILNNALNETLEALGGDEDEFQTRMGASKMHVERLLESINALLKQMQSS